MEFQSAADKLSDNFGPGFVAQQLDEKTPVLTLQLKFGA